MVVMDKIECTLNIHCTVYVQRMYSTFSTLFMWMLSCIETLTSSTLLFTKTASMH